MSERERECVCVCVCVCVRERVCARECVCERESTSSPREARDHARLDSSCGFISVACGTKRDVRRVPYTLKETSPTPLMRSPKLSKKSPAPSFRYQTELQEERHSLSSVLDLLRMTTEFHFIFIFGTL